MPRNFFRRVESCFPVEDPDHRTHLDEIINTYWADNVKAREQNSELTYAKVHPDGHPLDCQALFLERLTKRKRPELEVKPVVVKQPGKKEVSGGVDQPA
jgi:polyphosphate kinase